MSNVLEEINDTITNRELKKLDISVTALSETRLADTGC